MSKRIWIGIILVPLILNGCSDKKDPVLAKVDEEVITLSEFDARISKLPIQYQETIKKNKAAFLEDFVIELLFWKEAIRRSIDKQKDTKEVLKEAKRKILMAKFIEEEIENKISVKEGELRDYYEKFKDEFIEPEKFRASHILVKTEEKAAEVLNKLSSGIDFTELAKTESIDVTNRRGGDIGYFKKGQLIPEFESACYKLEVNQTSPIVKTSFGYHIIKLTDKKPAQIKSFEDVKDKIEAKIINLKRKERFNNIIQNLRNKSHIEINYDLLKDE